MKQTDYKNLSSLQKFTGVLAILILTVTIFISRSFSQSDEIMSEEYKIKAVYLYNFLKLTDFRDGKLAESNDTIKIAIFGEYPFEDAFEPLEGKDIKGKKLFVDRISNVGLLTNYKLLYIGESDVKDIKETISAASGAGILTVGESEEFTKAGGIIGFYMESAQVHFIINLKAAEKAGITFNSRLLQVAKTVRY